MNLNNLTLNLLKEIKETLDTRNGEITNNCFFLSNGILSLENETGCARYPYQHDGMLLWANQNGKVSLNESNFFLIPESLEGETNSLVYFLGVKHGELYKPYSLFEFNKNLYEGEVKRYTIFYPSYVLYILETEGIIYSLRMSVDINKNLIIESNVLNTNKEEKELYTSSFLNFKFMHGNYDSVETKWFKEARYANNVWNLYTVEDLSRFVHISNYGALSRCVSKEAQIENTTARGVYAGSRTGRIENSICLQQGKFNKEKDVTLFSEMSSAGDIVKFTLKENESISIVYKLERLNKRKEIKPLTIEEISTEFLELENLDNIKRNNKDYMKFFFEGDEFINANKFNKFLEQVLNQVDYCATAKNSSLSLLGVRDVFQAIEAGVYFEPLAMRNRIVDIINYLDLSGRFPRQFAFKSSNSDQIAIDNREFIDQGFWVFDAIYNYLAFTSDYSILDEEAGYIDVINRGTAKISEKRSSVLTHLFDVLDWIISNIDEDTGCLKTLYGDWNDAIDGLGMSSDENKRFGNGVSIMATFQLYSSLNKFIEILNKLGGYEGKINKFKSILDRLSNSIDKFAFVSNINKKKILHGWGEDRNFYVGSFSDLDNEDRYTLTSNSFYVLSNFYLHNPNYVDSVLEAYKVLDSKYGFKTFEPFFNLPSRKVGRIVNLPKGTAENAATYIHATTFALDSLFTLNEPNWAWEQIKKIVPFTHSYVTTTPFVMPNSYVYNKDIDCDGESMNDWYTGSSNTLIKSLVRGAFGLVINLDTLTIVTSTYFPFKKACLSIKIKNAHINLIHSSSSGERMIKLNGENLKLEKVGYRYGAIINKDLLKDGDVIEVIN